MRIFLIRHGRSKGNEDKENIKKLGVSKVPLVDAGWEQAIAAGKFLASYVQRHPLSEEKRFRQSQLEFGVAGQAPAVAPLLFWCSPFLRARETLSGIIYGGGGFLNGAAHKESTVLAEQDFGLFSYVIDPNERKQLMPLETAFVEAAARTEPHLAKAPQGQSFTELQQQLSAFTQKVRRDEARGIQDIAVVTHSVTMRALACDFLCIPPENYKKFPSPENCSIYVLEQDDARMRPPTIRQIYNGETMQEVDIDLTQVLGVGQPLPLPPVPDKFRLG